MADQGLFGQFCQVVRVADAKQLAGVVGAVRAARQRGFDNCARSIRIRKTQPDSAPSASLNDSAPKRSWKMRQKYPSLQQLIEQRRDTQLSCPFADIVEIDGPGEELLNITALQLRIWTQTRRTSLTTE